MRKEAYNGYQWIAHVVDHLSKYHVVWPMNNKTANEVVDDLKVRVFPYFCLPDIFQSDNGTEFKNQFVEKLIGQLQGRCTIRNGRARHPQSQGLIEQANGTLKKMLASMKLEEQDPIKQPDWPSRLPMVMFNLNNQKNSKTKTTAFEIVFNRKPNLAENLITIDDEIDQLANEDVVVHGLSISAQDRNLDNENNQLSQIDETSDQLSMQLID
jgi:transposase InsO family protein